jgi:hypothetical protein
MDATVGVDIKRYSSGSRKSPIFLVRRHFIVWQSLKSFTSQGVSLTELACRVREAYPKEPMSQNYVSSVTSELVSTGLVDRTGHGVVAATAAEWPQDPKAAEPLTKVSQTDGHKKRRSSVSVAARFGENETVVFDFLKSYGPAEAERISRSTGLPERAVREAVSSLCNKVVLGKDFASGVCAILEGASISPYAPGKLGTSADGVPSKSLKESVLKTALKDVCSQLSWSVQRQLGMQPPYPPRVQEWLTKSQEILTKVEILTGEFK